MIVGYVVFVLLVGLGVEVFFQFFVVFDLEFVVYCQVLFQVWVWLVFSLLVVWVGVGWFGGWLVCRECF